MIGKRTYSAKEGDFERRWYLVDAEGKSLGRISTEIARILRGKHKPIFTPHVDTGDFVIVVNAEKVNLTGRKLEQKKYYRHSGYFGGLSEIVAKDLLAKHPDRIIRFAVKGMLPGTTLGRHQLKKLKIYAGSEHPHEAQKPEKLEL